MKQVLSIYVHRDLTHPGADLSQMYSNSVKEECDKLKAEGAGPSCFIAESLQSCGGQIIYPENYLRDVYAHIRDAGGICIADEVQVGFGRVGTHWWAFETQGVVPDIVTIGKPMVSKYTKPFVKVIMKRKKYNTSK